MARDPLANARWEMLDDPDSGLNVETQFARIRVPGGWLYRTIISYAGLTNGAGVSVTQTFIPDPFNT